ncbi:MAG: glycosyl hydrolase 115 family protein, partial [Proteiniphilum sp.]
MMSLSGKNIQLLDKTTDGSFPLAAVSLKTEIVTDSDDPLSVKTAATLFADDIKRVTGREVSLTDCDAVTAPYIVLVGTLENNRLIRELAAKKKISTSEIEGSWERFIIQVVDNPFSNVSKALVVAGSDRRGAAYGLFTLSETIGVSPWYWWADVPVEKRNELHLTVDRFVSQTPSVKYRGLFINDEDWGLLPWAKHTFDPEL